MNATVMNLARDLSHDTERDIVEYLEKIAQARALWAWYFVATEEFDRRTFDQTDIQGHAFPLDSDEQQESTKFALKCLAELNRLRHNYRISHETTEDARRYMLKHIP